MKTVLKLTGLFVLLICLEGCDSRSQQHFSAENLRLIPEQNTIVMRVRDEDGGGPVRYLIVKSLPKDYADGFKDYLTKFSSRISGGHITIEAFWGTWSNTQEKDVHLCMTFRRPLASNEDDTSWGTYLPYESVSVVRQLNLPATAATNTNLEVSFGTCDVTYQQQRVRGFGKRFSGP